MTQQVPFSMLSGVSDDTVGAAAAAATSAANTATAAVALLGTASTKNVGTAANNVVQLDGPVTGAKVWSGTTTTDVNGAWSVNYSTAGFTSAPRIQATCTSSGATAADMLNAKTTTKSATAASGIATAPALSVLGLITVSLVGAGVSVDVVAVGK